MKRHVITADALYAARNNGQKELHVPGNALLTPQAVDTAKSLGITVVRGAAVASEAPARSTGAPQAAGSGSVTTAMPAGAGATASGSSTAASSRVTDSSACPDCLPDIRDLDLFDSIPVKNPRDPEFLAKLKNAGPARICLDRAGPRYKTKSLLRFKADHAAAVDAAFTDVSDDFLKRMNLPDFSILCQDRQEYLRRPDLGRTLAPVTLEAVRKVVGPSPKILIYFADGLSSTALETNGPDTYLSLVAGLKRHGLTPCAPFFLRRARVPAQDCIAVATGAEVICTLIGERPGLITAESLSAYFSYRPFVDMPEARRTVVSNIHKGGTPAVEAGAYIADIIKLMLEKKAGGTDLPL